MHFVGCPNKQSRLSGSIHTKEIEFSLIFLKRGKDESSCEKIKFNQGKEGILTYISQDYHPFPIHTENFYKNISYTIQQHRTALGRFSQTHSGDWGKTDYIPPSRDSQNKVHFKEQSRVKI